MHSKLIAWRNLEAIWHKFKGEDDKDMDRIGVELLELESIANDVVNSEVEDDEGVSWIVDTRANEVGDTTADLWVSLMVDGWEV